MNRIDTLFENKKDILNVYYTAGFPKLDDTVRIAKSLEKAGADMLEIGMPFSDPVADGPTIQQSSEQALQNGMTIRRLFEQLKDLRKEVTIPVLLMGYVNPILQFGIEAFCDACVKVGVDGLIIPDLPMQEYLNSYKTYFADRGIHNIFLISPNTTDDRIRQIEMHSGGFIYVVSSSSITGAKVGVQEGQEQYYRRIQEMNLAIPQLIGFGISDKESFRAACTYAKGAIIGSAFIRQLGADSSDKSIQEFVQRIKS